MLKTIRRFYEWYLETFKEYQTGIGEYHFPETQKAKEKAEKLIANLKSLEKEFEE